MKILVGLSGGVDSAVAAAILKNEGHEVIGATMSIWGKDEYHDFKGHSNACFGPDEIKNIQEAEKIAKKLEIPYITVDCRNNYEKTVVENFRSEYLSGRTPNPCVWCNEKIKFGVFPNSAKKQGVIFDKFATGHYAKIGKVEGETCLKRGVDPKKDQTYFLYRLSKEQISDLILPLGGYTKDEIRKMAADFNLEVANKPDSQDFYGGDYSELLKAGKKQGNIVDTNGKILGTHDGIWNFTVGQRRGIKVSSTEPLYVISLNEKTNEVIVGHKDKTFNKSLIAKNLNFQINPERYEGKVISAKIRSVQTPTEAKFKFIDKETIEIIFEEYQKSIAIGQSAVLYDNDVLIGGGIIESAK